jgi:hypothetical protein
MARPLRLELAGGVYHVTSRGDGRDDIYLSDDDRGRLAGGFRAIALYFGVHYSTVSRAVKNHEEKRGMRA